MSNELTPEPESPKSAVRVAPVMGGALNRRLVWTSFDIAKPEQVEDMAAVLTGDSNIIWDHCPLTIDVVHIVIAETEEVDEETGELVVKVRTRFVTPDGQVWMTGSNSVYGNVQMLASAWGEPPWKPARRLYFYTQKTRGGHTCLIVSNRPKASPTPINSVPQSDSGSVPSATKPLKTQPRPTSA